MILVDVFFLIRMDLFFTESIKTNLSLQLEIGVWRVEVTFDFNPCEIIQLKGPRL